jgi:hypothetical protein
MVWGLPNGLEDGFIKKRAPANRKKGFHVQAVLQKSEGIREIFELSSKELDFL